MSAFSTRISHIAPSPSEAVSGRPAERVTPVFVTLMGHEGIVCQMPVAMSAERRALVRAVLQSANVILVGLLLYKLWNNKWTKLNFNKEAKF